jgi:hypothetical protein
MLQGRAVQKLHGDERFAVLIVNFVDRADVGMVQGRSRLGFALESAERVRVFGYLVGQELQGYKAAKLHVLSLVDNAHAATAQFLDNAVVRYGLANHLSRILRVGNDQVNECDAGSRWPRQQEGHGFSPCGKPSDSSLSFLSHRILRRIFLAITKGENDENRPANS